MFNDYENRFWNNEAVLADGQSQSIDLGADYAIGGKALDVFLTVTEAYNNLTNIAFTLQSDVDDAWSGQTDHWVKTVLLASLTLGARIYLGTLPGDCLRYVRLDAALTGTTPTTGKLSGFLEIAQPHNNV